MIGFQRGQIVKVNIVGHSRYKPDDKIIVLVPNGAVKFNSLHDRYGAKYMMVTKLDHFELYKHYSAEALIEIWRNKPSDDHPIYVFDYKEFDLFPIGNAQNAKLTLEGLDL